MFVAWRAIVLGMVRVEVVTPASSATPIIHHVSLGESDHAIAVLPAAPALSPCAPFAATLSIHRCVTPVPTDGVPAPLSPTMPIIIMVASVEATVALAAVLVPVVTVAVPNGFVSWLAPV